MSSNGPDDLPPSQGADLRQRYAEAIAYWALRYPIPAWRLAEGSSAERLAQNWGEVAAKYVVEVRDAELEKLRSQVADYENGISWFTTCTGCAKILDRARFQEERAEKAEAELASAQARIDGIRRLADDLALEDHPSHDHLCPDDVRKDILAVLDHPDPTPS